MNLKIQRFSKGHKFYTDSIENYQGEQFQATFGQCLNADTGDFIDYTMERRDTLIPEGKYEFDYYDSPANKCKVVLLTKNPQGEDISNRKLEHHIANFPNELKGCTAHGTVINTNTPAILNSRIAFNDFMIKLNNKSGTIIYETLKS